MTETYETRGAVFAADPIRQRISWGAIFAGLVSALTLMVILSVLGLAVGFSSVDADDRASNYGMGVGIWGALTALVSFFFGGWMAGWIKPTGHGANGMLQGALVWMVAIVLLAYLVAGGVSSAVKAAGSVASTGAQVASTSMNATTNNPAMNGNLRSTTHEASNDLQARANDLRQQATPENVEKAASTAARGSWGTLASLLLTFAAAAVGGHLGGGHNTRTVVRRDTNTIA